MVEARWKGVVIARSDDTVVVEGNHYFPLDSIDPTVLRPSATTTVCPWKGTANYYSLVVGGEENRKRCSQATAVHGMSSPTLFAG